MSKNYIKDNPFEMGSLYKLISHDDDIAFDEPIDKDVLMYIGITYNSYRDPCYMFYMLKYKMNTCIYVGHISEGPAKSRIKLEKI